MFLYLSQYLSYYYNYYFNNNILENKINTENINTENINNSFNTSSLEVNNSYNLLFSTNPNSPNNLELIFYKIYSNNNISHYESINSTIFKYDNKIFKINSKENYNNYISVIQTILNYKLKNIVLPEQIYNNKFTKQEYIEIFHYYPDGDLFNYIYNQTLSLSQKKYIFKQLVNIISPFHKIGLVHRDIKMENFLIHFDNNNEIKIKLTDLDFACIGTTDLTFTGGTMHYASYELMNNKEFTSWFSSDIWSLNIILYILLFNKFPWNNAIEYQTYNKNKFITEEPCDKFNTYLISEPSNYWNERLSLLFDKNDIHFSIYSKILTYGFNINCNERTDISYIQNLLTLI